MLVKFNQAVHLPPGPQGKDYARGIFEVPLEAIQHPFFHKLIQAGMVEDADAGKIVAAQSEADRKAALIEKIVQMAAPKAPPEPESKPAAPALSEDEELAQLEKEEAEQDVRAAMKEAKEAPKKKQSKR